MEPIYFTLNDNKGKDENISNDEVEDNAKNSSASGFCIEIFILCIDFDKVKSI